MNTTNTRGVGNGSTTAGASKALTPEQRAEADQRQADAMAARWAKLEASK